MKLQNAIAKEMAAQLGVGYDDLTSEGKGYWDRRAAAILTVFVDFVRVNCDIAMSDQINALIAEEHV